MANGTNSSAPSGGGENWGSKIGVILAVAGSAVGLGNFLRFPGQAASHGGIFMIPYFISLLLVGIPLCWAEWSMGRHGGARGYNSTPGVFHALWRNPASKYFGVLSLIIPVVIYMYYCYIEVWCLRYAIGYATGEMAKVGDFSAHFQSMAGMAEHGFPSSGMLLLVLLVFALNFFLIYRGVTKGIEVFCKYAMPALIALAIVILFYVLSLGTPDPAFPERNISNALGFMWNPQPDKTGSYLGALINPQLWLDAAGQIFFSLSVGFGIILNYSSYLRRDDDVALSGLTSSATNEFCEVCLGGLITVPVAFLFLGAIDQETLGSTIALGFFALPEVFDRMPAGQFFGGLWFLMLFLAAITSSLSMLQPAIAFFEEAYGLGRRASVVILGMIVSAGALIVIFFSRNLVALDTMDTWVGTFLIFFLAMIQTIMFGWIFGVTRGKRELERGAEIPIPKIYWPIIKYVSPIYLLAIFIGYCTFTLPGTIRGIRASEDGEVIALVLLFIGFMALAFGVLIHLAGDRWDQIARRGEEEVSI